MKRKQKQPTGKGKTAKRERPIPVPKKSKLARRPQPDAALRALSEQSPDLVQAAKALGLPVDMNHRQEANALVAASLRNNTSLESIHSAGGISDSQMKTLMIEVCSNLAVLLRMRDELPRSTYAVYLWSKSLNTAAGWDEVQQTGALARAAYDLEE